VGFLVAFFFIVLFSLGLDLLAAVPGFFIAAIHIPPIGFAAAGRASELIVCCLNCCDYRNVLCPDQAVSKKI
jgi:hypothetical protein